jgi:GT2 family glycosyltransferase
MMIFPNIVKNEMNLSIIIINYNLAQEIDNCLKSLYQTLDSQKNFGYEIIIVDNNSPDKKLPEIEKKFQKDNIQFYYLTENIGFGKGCNYGFSKASGRYVCFLNPDTIIKENIFLPIINHFEKDNTIGIIGPKQQVRFPFFDFSAGFYPNVFIELFSLLGVSVFLEAFIVYALTRLKRNKTIKVDWILGAAIFIRSDLFERINGFDKDYFMFSEEVDLCKRVSNEGFNIIYFPKYSIHHIGSVSGKRDYKLYAIRAFSSKYIFISKHYKSLNKFLMKSLLYLQMVSQIVIWSILYPIYKQKSKQKIAASIYLLRNKMKLN